MLGFGCVAIMAAESDAAAPTRPQRPSPRTAGPIATVFGVTLLAAGTVHLARTSALENRTAGQSPWHPSDRRSAQPAKLLLWFTWPAWPLTLWTLWRCRRQLTARTWRCHCGLRSSRCSPPARPAFRTARCCSHCPRSRRSPPSRCRRSDAASSALIDWFTLLFFSGSAVMIWASGSRCRPVSAPRAASVGRLVPDSYRLFLDHPDLRRGRNDCLGLAGSGAPGVIVPHSGRRWSCRQAVPRCAGCSEPRSGCRRWTTLSYARRCASSPSPSASRPASPRCRSTGLTSQRCGTMGISHEALVAEGVNCPLADRRP